MLPLKEISITEIENIKIGNAEDTEHATGCTMLICEKGMPAGIDVRGGGPASRESELLNPCATTDVIHAVLLSGGSAFGLDAAGGVMEYLAEKGVGFAIGDIHVPLVCESCIFDLLFVSDKVKPDKRMAYKACLNAEKNSPTQGNVGAGTGASVGKICGSDRMMNSGLGIYAAQLGELKVGAVVAVNAMGDVYDFESGKILAGARTADGKGFADSEKILYENFLVNPVTAPSNTNTTIGAIITNAKFDKAKLNKIAAMGQNGLARSIRPVHTMNDGDTVYALSIGDIEADVNVVGTLASHVMACAIRNAVLESGTFHNIPGAKRRSR
ncbi:MAG: P1 family peptidase [Clostridiales bacterium]|nr:P1 family peptidase [Clostridiales bacterium]